MTPDQLLLAGGLALGGAFWWSHRGEPKDMSKAHPPPVGPRGPIYSLLHPMREPLPIGNRKIDFYEQHIAMLAMSGGFKTTVQAYILRERLKAGRPCVVLTGGDSDQLEEEIKAWGGYVIRPHDSPLKFNAFEGTATYMAQGWAGLFPTSSEAKVYHSAFEIACIRYFQTHSHYSVSGLMDFIQEYNPDKDPIGSVENEKGERLAKLDGRLWKGMREGYVGIRLQLMEMAFGDWIGDELSVLHCVKQRIPIMFVLDSADDPDLNRFACALVWQAINYAVRQHGDFDVFVDELGRLPVDLVSDQVRTWRRNKCHLVAGSHADSDFSDILDDLIHIRLLGQMVASATETRKAASEKTWDTVHPINFGPHVLGQEWTRAHGWLHRRRQGKFWMVDRERVQQVSVNDYRPPKVRVPRWSIYHLNATAKKSYRVRDTGPGQAATQKTGSSPAYVVVQTVPDPIRPALPQRASLDGTGSPNVVVPMRVVVSHDESVPTWASEPWLASMWRESRPTHTAALLWRPGFAVWVDEEGCREWHGGYFKPKNGAPWRPRKWFKDHGDVNPYREFVRAAGGSPDPTCDHWCDNPACVKLEHLEGGVDFDENTRRNGPRRAAFKAVGWRLVKAEHFDSCAKGCAFEHRRWREGGAASGRREQEGVAV